MNYSTTTAGGSAMTDLHLQFVDVVAHAYAASRDFDEMCEIIERDGYDVQDTAWVWSVLSQDAGLREDQMTRLTTWIRSSEGNYRRFHRWVETKTPEKISDRLQQQMVNDQVVLLDPDVVTDFIGSRLDGISSHPHRLFQYWLSEDQVFRAKFCAALRIQDTTDLIDRALDLDPGTTRQLLLWNAGPRKIFCAAHPDRRQAKERQKRTFFEDSVRAGKTYEEVQAATGRSRKSMADTWREMHPLIQDDNIDTYYTKKLDKEMKRYEEDGDRYELLQNLAPPVLQSE